MLLATLRSIQDLSSPTRGWTRTPALEGQSLTQWTTSKVPAGISCAGCHREKEEAGMIRPSSLCLVFLILPLYPVPLLHWVIPICMICAFDKKKYLIILVCLGLCVLTQSCPILCDPLDYIPPGSSVHGIFPDKNTRVSCHFLLQGIFPTQGSNPWLLHCRRIFFFYYWATGETPRLVVLRIKKKNQNS